MIGVRSSACLLCVIVAGCAWFQEEDVTYLKQAAAHHATQAEVKRRLGIPYVEQSFPNGDTIWIYRILKNTGGDHGNRTYCDGYSLRFDREATLRDWNPQDC